MDSLFGKEIIMSISFDNDEIIRNIMSLYQIERFDLDCTYSKGVFWKNLPQPLHKTDLLPQKRGVKKADSIALPFKDSSMRSIMFDPPFVIAGETYREGGDNSNIISKRFESYNSFDALKAHYLGTLKEAYRLLKPKGILVFKCQDVVANGLNHFSHCIIQQMAISVGFYPKDLFILLSKNRINSFSDNKWKTQYHARKYHSYFWVLQKRPCKVDYTY